MRKIGIIGCGNMGFAISQRLKDVFRLWVCDKDKSKTDKLSGVNITDELTDLMNKSDVVILAVKPQDFEDLLNKIKSYIGIKLVISIAAGITTNYIERRLGNAKVVRVMPNMPAKIGQAMSCICKGKFATKGDLDFAKHLFDNLGETLILSEDMMDAATAVSGSGPGYFYDLIKDKNLDEIEKYANDIFVPSLAASAISLGFSSEQAKKLAEATTKGSIQLLKEARLPPSELKKQVASKGGTTQAGLEVLHKGGSLKDAVKAALKRAKELSRR